MNTMPLHGIDGADLQDLARPGLNTLCDRSTTCKWQQRGKTSAARKNDDGEHLNSFKEEKERKILLEYILNQSKYRVRK